MIKHVDDISLNTYVYTLALTAMCIVFTSKLGQYRVLHDIFDTLQLCTIKTYLYSRGIALGDVGIFVCRIPLSDIFTCEFYLCKSCESSAGHINFYHKKKFYCQCHTLQCMKR